VILFQDTDSICKRYLLDEEFIQETRDAVAAAESLAASVLSYVEVRGVLARARRARRIANNRSYIRLSEEFEEDWDGYFRIGVSESIVLEAGRLAEKHFLRGMDAIQLASALALSSLTTMPILVSTWDRNSGLIGAIRAEGLSLAHEAVT
jgi:predicted nucleic acid-binding protein